MPEALAQDKKKSSGSTNIQQKGAEAAVPAGQNKSSLGQGNLAAAIASGESDGCGGYDAFNVTKGKTCTYSSKEGDLIEGKKLTAYTLGEMLDLSKRASLSITHADGKKASYNGKLWAAGRYQVTAQTLHGKMYKGQDFGIRHGMKEFGPTTVYNQDTQDKCYEYIINKTRKPIHNYLYGNGDIDAAAKSVAQCWASVGVKGTNKSYYAGDGMNATNAHTSYETIIAALKADKAAIQRGEMPVATAKPAAQETKSSTSKPAASPKANELPEVTVIGKKPANKSAETSYTVQSGDSFWRIAQKFSVPGGYQRLCEYNGLSKNHVLHVGDVLRIPGAASTTPVAAEKPVVKVQPKPVERPKEDTKAKPEPEKSKASNVDTKKQTSPAQTNSGKNTDGVTVESGRYITSNDVVIRTKPSDNASKVTLLYLNHGKLKPSTVLKKGMSVTPLKDEPQTDSNGNIWTKIQHYNRKNKHVGWIKNLDKVSDTNAIVGDPSKKDNVAPIGKQKGVGLAKTVLNNLNNSSAGANACQAYVADVTSKATGQRMSAPSAQDAWRNWGISTDYSNIPIAAAVYFTSPCASECGHVGVHVGNGMIQHQLSKRVKESLADVTKNHNYKFRAWGWNGGVKLKQPDEE